MRQYRLPLRLITKRLWQAMNPPARAILPPMGLHADDSGKAFPGRDLIQKLSGVKANASFAEGLKCLTDLDLIEIIKTPQPGKQGRRNLYYLKPPAIWESSYYPMYEDFFTGGRWADLSWGEKATWAVLAVKATLKSCNYPEKFARFRLDTDWRGCGTLRGNWYKLAGISRAAWYSALQTLNHRGEILPLAKQGYLLAKPETQGNKRSPNNEPNKSK